MYTQLRKQFYMSRRAWGSTLVGAAVVALGCALLLEHWGFSLGGWGPLAFVGTVVTIKLSLFAFWPALTRLARQEPVLKELFAQPSSHSNKDNRNNKDKDNRNNKDESQAAPRAKEKRSSITLWDDPARLSTALFATNLPTFIVSADQRILDWNGAFQLVFGLEPSLHRGAPTGAWYELLDNFRRVSLRQAKLYGEGILPLADRERAVYVSPVYGRMVFTKVLAPLIDLATGKIVGWSIVLNINSVHHRAAFFTALNATIDQESKRIRYAAAYDRLFDRFSGRRDLIERQVSALRGAKRILDLGCGTGSLAAAFLAEGHRVTAVDGDQHLLRHARQRCALFGQVKLVRKPLADLSALPQERYDGATLCYHLQLVSEPELLLQRTYAALKHGGLLALTVRADDSSFTSLFAAIGAQLEERGAYQVLAHQLEQVRGFAMAEEAERGRAPSLTLAAIHAMLDAVGFMVTVETPGLEDGQSLLIIARKG